MSKYLHVMDKLRSMSVDLYIQPDNFGRRAGARARSNGELAVDGLRSLSSTLDDPLSSSLGCPNAEWADAEKNYGT